MLRLRLILGVLICCLAASMSLAASALATPPSAGDDTMLASPNGVRDVLYNDHDPDGTGSAMRVVASSQPAHGHVSCSPLGSCFYEGDPAYAGGDAFTYTVRDEAGEESTATVTVTAKVNDATKALIARDDDAATAAGRPVTVAVLRNDTGGKPPVRVITHSDAQHGTVSCDDTTCTYTPADGYSGTDGFHYTIQDSGTGTPPQSELARAGRRALSSGATSTADVHILVAPAGAGYGLSMTGAPDDASAGGAVPSGGLARWFAGVAGTPAGITGEELGALPLPSVTAKPGGAHAVTGDVKTATGWKASGGDGGGVNLTATKDALLGEGATEAFPKPLPPISQGTGGDGHVPILVGSKVFAFYHHSQPTSATCVDRVTGAACPGYPKQLDWSTSDINGPGAVVGSQIWTRLQPTYFGGPAQTVSYGMYCWDTEQDTTCGYVAVDRADQSSAPTGSAPVLVGGRLWFATEQAKLFCVDPDTHQACGEYPTGQAAGAISPSCCAMKGMDIATHGTRVFVSRGGDTVACFDTATRSACPGWDTPKSFGGAYNLVNYYDSDGSGTAIGVCVLGSNTGNGTCVPDADPSSTTPLSGWPDKGRSYAYYSMYEEAETGTRTIIGSLSSDGVGCFDWTTMKPCTGGGYDATGWLALAYPQQAYGVAWDGACAIGVGDPGHVFTVDPAGTAPCLSLRSGAQQRVLDLRDQRCDGTVGAARWRDVTLSDTDASEMDAITVTVRDARTKAVLASGNLIDGDHKLDLSGIDPAEHPAITVDANAQSKSGNHAWDDAIPPRITVHWKADPQQACMTTRTSSECGATSPLRLTMAGHLADPARDAEAGLDALRNPCGSVAVAAAAVPRRCSGVRQFSIHIHYPSSKVRRVSVTINGKAQKRLSMKGRPVFRVDLRKFSRQRVVVKIAIRTKSGKLLKGNRVYNTCTPKRPDHGFTL